MPVIGRLDDQVDEVLIRPLSKGREREDDAAPETPTHSPRPSDAEEAATERHDDSRTRTELPVWLL